MSRGSKSWVWSLAHRGEGELENYAVCNLCGQRIKVRQSVKDLMVNIDDAVFKYDLRTPP
jgi:hypothetical protein